MNRKLFVTLALPASTLISVVALAEQPEPEGATEARTESPVPLSEAPMARTPTQTPYPAPPAPPSAPPAPPPPAPPAPPPLPSPAEVLPELPEGANVIIYRANAQPTVWASTVKIDGKKLAALGNKKWTATRLDPGTYEIKIGWSFMSGQSGGKYTLTVVEGRTHFLEIVGQSQYAGGYGAGGMTFNMGSGIGEVIGRGVLRRVENCCTFKEPKY